MKRIDLSKNRWHWIKGKFKFTVKIYRQGNWGEKAKSKNKINKMCAQMKTLNFLTFLISHEWIPIVWLIYFGFTLIIFWRRFFCFVFVLAILLRCLFFFLFYFCFVCFSLVHSSQFLSNLMFCLFLLLLFLSFFLSLSLFFSCVRL